MEDHHEKILSVILDKNEITWQTIIYELINSEKMDPWDVDISLITRRYIDMLNVLKEMDFRVGGKVVLAAAMLLKIKSSRWVEEDIANLDALFHSADEPEDLLDFDESDYTPRETVDATLIPRMPQPRKRKVSVYDLVNALEKALEVKHRRIVRNMPILNVEAPRRKVDVTQLIKDMYGQIKEFFQKKPERLTFEKLSASDKESRIYTFIPLLHLTNQGKIDMHQSQHFGEIEIEMKEAL